MNCELSLLQFKTYLSTTQSYTIICLLTLIMLTFVNVLFQDTIATAVFSLLFFIASCAWAAGLNDIKWWTTFSNVRNRFYSDVCTDGVAECTGENGGYAGLNVSIVSIWSLLMFVWVYVWTGWFVSLITAVYAKNLKKKTFVTKLLRTFVLGCAFDSPTVWLFFSPFWFLFIYLFIFFKENWQNWP